MVKIKSLQLLKQGKIKDIEDINGVIRKISPNSDIPIDDEINKVEKTSKLITQSENDKLSNEVEEHDKVMFKNTDKKSETHGSEDSENIIKSRANKQSCNTTTKNQTIEEVSRELKQTERPSSNIVPINNIKLFIVTINSNGDKKLIAKTLIDQVKTMIHTEFNGEDDYELEVDDINKETVKITKQTVIIDENEEDFWFETVDINKNKIFIKLKDYQELVPK
jgi:hypothetical protein